MKIYIAGKIGDLPYEVYAPKFEEAEAVVRQMGGVPYNPVKLTHHLPLGTPYEDYISCTLKILQDFTREQDGILMLEDWEDSPGACREHQLALGMDLTIIYKIIVKEVKGIEVAYIHTTPMTRKLFGPDKDACFKAGLMIPEGKVKNYVPCTYYPPIEITK